MGHGEQCVERYLELAKLPPGSRKAALTPGLDDHSLVDEDHETRGELAKDCARIVLKVLYLARMKRLDLLYSVNALARDVTRWTVACDKKLHRMIGYLNTTKDYSQICMVGDNFEDCQILMFVDAGFAGDLTDSKSTGGCISFLIGPNTCVPLSWACKELGSVCHSSTEAEVISLDMGGTATRWHSSTTFVGGNGAYVY